MSQKPGTERLQGEFKRVMHTNMDTSTALLVPVVKAKAGKAVEPKLLWLISSSWLRAVHPI